AGELNAREVELRSVHGLAEVALVLHGRDRAPLLEGLRDRGRGLVGELHARERLAVEAELVDRLPEEQVALAGRVEVRGTHDLVAAAQRGPQRLDDVADLRLLLALPREVVEVPRQVVQVP